jgi:serpin B
MLVLAGCTPAVIGVTLVPDGRPLQTASQARPVGQLTTAIDDFGLELLKATAADGGGGNTIVSPVSVHAALSMTVNGATGETAQQMRDVLHVASIEPTATNQQWAALLAGLGSRSSAQTLEIANALWARKDIAFKQPFIDADRDFFGARLTTLDFGKDDVAGAINGWVSKNTHGMIAKIVDQVPSNAILYLTNAVYFKGDWVTPFEHEATFKQTFNRADSSTVDVDMMHASEPLPYVENATLQATKLLYKGDDTAYYVLLPKPGVSLNAAEASLEGTGFADLWKVMRSGATTEVVLGLPKLDAEFSTDLAKPLANMGMPRAFDADRAQFSGMATLDVPIYISRVLHKTKVKVDEKGTVAAAATSVEMSAGAVAPVVAPARIICDRPYLFAIVDEKTGAMLFIGAINDPTK